MGQHNVWCVRVAFCVERYAGAYLSTFKFSDFNKEPTSSLKMILNDDRNMLERF